MNTLRRKVIAAVLLAFFLFLLGSAGMTALGVHQALEREASRNARKVESISELIQMRSEETGIAMENYLGNNRNHVRFMSSALEFFAEGDRYEGDRVFSDGFVIERRGDEIIYPSELKKPPVEITAELIDRALEDPDNFAGYVPKTGGGEPVPAGTEDLEDLYGVFVSHIAGNYYYLDYTAGEDIDEYLEAHLDENSLISAIENAYGGAVLLIDPTDDNLPFVESSIFPGVGSAKELGFTRRILERQEKIVMIRGQVWQCVYKSMPESVSILVFAQPYGLAIAESRTQALFVMLCMLLIFLTLIAYVVLTQKFVRDRILSDFSLQRYYPDKLRRRLFMAGAVGAVFIFAAAMMVQAMSGLRSETLAGRDTVRVFFEQFRSDDSYRSRNTREEEEYWYIYYGMRMAELLSKTPELATREKLQQFCDDLEIDYIMLFDETGRETMSSTSYTGYHLPNSQRSGWGDFRRLLQGVPYVVHEPETDSFTGLNRQLIGVTVPVPGTGQNGALVMAVMPERIEEAKGIYGINEQLGRMVPGENSCFIADDKSGDILYASDSSFIGGNIREYGFGENSLRNGYMDFRSVNGKKSYIFTSKSDSNVLYYITETPVLFQNIVSFGAAAALVFSLIYVALFLLLMSGYTEAEVQRLGSLGVPAPQDPIVEVKTQSGEMKRMRDPSRRWLFYLADWGEMYPEEKAAVVLKAALVLAVALYMILIRSQAARYGNSISLVQYIMQGDWMRGFNLFGICAVVISVVTTFLFLVICKTVCMLICGSLDNKGETICRLVYNLVEYVMVLVTAYRCFNYLGFPSETVVASIGLASLAVSLGAQGLVADVLAGLSIVFEGEFQVGDIVDIDGFEGTIQQIGVRTTKIRGKEDDNVKIIENSGIKNVINKSNFNSWVYTDLYVPCSEPLLDIEKIFDEELPKITAGCDKIISGPKYIGVDELGGPQIMPYEPTMTLRIATECADADYLEVKRYVNREIFLLCGRRDIRTI